MQLSQERINEIKAAHPDAWRERAASGLSHQLVAAAILSQVEHDAKNPPEEEALRRVKAAGQIVLVHIGRQQQAQQDLKRVLEEVHAQFPDLDLSELEIALVTAGAGGDEGAARLIAELREQIRVHEQAGDALDARAERDSQEITRLTGELNESRLAVSAAQSAEAAAKETAEQHRIELGLFQELLNKISVCGNIKEVRALFGTSRVE